ncbi:MAG: RES family NAD+ phosphorylase [Gemmatimonadaceae bacterium]
MHLFRICRRAFRALDGEGARLCGGRWNSVGKAAICTSTTLSLAAIEYLVHIDPADAPNDLLALTIDVPDDIRSQTVDVDVLPSTWAQWTDNAECRALGDDWLDRGLTALLRVPSAPIPSETNVIVNPRHADAARVRIIEERPFVFDPRLR